ncbi:MAG: N-6 DNA methylase [Thermoproteota archaeon]
MVNKIEQAYEIIQREGLTTTSCIEQLSWLIFLKAFENLERKRKHEAELEGEQYEPTIEPKYSWSSWAKKDIDAYELKSFIENELLPYLKNLHGSKERKIIATAFSEAKQNMKNATNLKEVVLTLNDIDFMKLENLSMLSQFYEELLVKVGSESGSVGEYYTPRPIIRLMVKIAHPKMNETVFDPFCGSCGFLIESLKWMKAQSELTPKYYKILEEKTFYAQELNPLLYLVGIVNCVLHALFLPNIERRDTFEENVVRVPPQTFDVILTNPPFGKSLAKSLEGNFPVPTNSAELAALQYCMKKLKKNGRCGIVLSEGVLFKGGDFKEVRMKLLGDFNVHTIISLPPGAFTYMALKGGKGPKINLVFFDSNGPTKEIWYYELTPEKSYSKANPLRDEDLVDCFEKWKNKETSENSWIVPVEDIIKRDYDITAKNPNKKQEVVRIAPEKLVEGLIVKERQILEILEGLRKLLSEKSKAKQDKFNDSTKEEAQGFYDLSKKWTWAKLGELISIEAGKRPVGGSSKEGVPSLGGEQLLPSGEINWEKLRYIPEDFYDSMRRGKVKLGDVLIVKDGATTGKTAYVKYLPFEKVAVNEHIFILRSRDENKLLNEYLFFVLLSELGQRQIKKFFHGTAQGGITRSNVEEVLIPLPTVEDQKRMATYLSKVKESVEVLRKLQKNQEDELEKLMSLVLEEVFEEAAD